MDSRPAKGRPSARFIARFEITITSVETFQIDGKACRVGHVADVYALHFSGKLTATAAPSAYVAGAAGGGGSENVGKD